MGAVVPLGAQVLVPEGVSEGAWWLYWCFERLYRCYGCYGDKPVLHRPCTARSQKLGRLLGGGRAVVPLVGFQR